MTLSCASSTNISRFWLAIFAGVLTATLCTGTAAAAEPADPAEWPIPVEAIEEELAAALGDSFELLGSEIGLRADDVGTKWPERLLWGKVRAKKAGEFAFVHTFDFEWPEEVKKNWRKSERGEYVIPIEIAERGTARLIRPDGHGGPAHPHANVGDALLIPLHVDRFRTHHRLAAAGEEQRYPKIFFDNRKTFGHEEYLKLAAEKPVVRNDAADRLTLLASWRRSSIDRSGAEVHQLLSGYVELAAAGEFNLGGRLEDADETAAGDGVPLRVVARDKPVTVVITHSQYTEYRGKGRTISSSGVPSGTLEARVGDRLLIECGQYVTAVDDGAPEQHDGVVHILPVKHVEHYVAEPPK